MQATPEDTSDIRTVVGILVDERQGTSAVIIGDYRSTAPPAPEITHEILFDMIMNDIASARSTLRAKITSASDIRVEWIGPGGQVGWYMTTTPVDPPHYLCFMQNFTRRGFFTFMIQCKTRHYEYDIRTDGVITAIRAGQPRKFMQTGRG